MFGPAYAQPKQTIGVPPAPPTIPSDMALKLSEQIGEYREISKRVDTLTADVKEIKGDIKTFHEKVTVIYTIADFVKYIVGLSIAGILLPLVWGFVKRRLFGNGG